MTFSFSGPSVAGLWFGLAGATFVGAVFDLSVFKESSKGFSILVLMAREVADLALYQLASFLVEATPRNQAKVYAATNLTVNVATLIVLRRLQLIGTIGTAVFSSLMAIEMTCKCVNFSKYRTVS